MQRVLIGAAVLAAVLVLHGCVQNASRQASPASVSEICEEVRRDFRLPRTITDPCDPDSGAHTFFDETFVGAANVDFKREFDSATARGAQLCAEIVDNVGSAKIKVNAGIVLAPEAFVPGVDQLTAAVTLKAGDNELEVEDINDDGWGHGDGHDHEPDGDEDGASDDNGDVGTLRIRIVVPFDDGANGAELVRQLANPDPAVRSEAAFRLLRLSEQRKHSALALAIRHAALLGEHRALGDLERIATARGVDGISLFPYATPTRIAASAAIGRLVEKVGSPSGPVTADARSRAVGSLIVASCPGENAQLRGAALEGLGLLRSVRGDGLPRTDASRS